MLRVKDLHVQYGSAEALKGVSIHIDEGEMIALLGANGAGKTTFLWALSGMIKPAFGTIEFRGTRIDKFPTYKIVRLGIVHVPQGRHLFPDMTVSENLELGWCGNNNAKDLQQELQKIFSYFEVLSKLKNRKAGTLSGGEQQMLAIGRAMMLKPKLFLLDEPSLGLAPVIVEDLGRIISNLHKEGMTILLVEQNAWLALELADRAYVLENGSIKVSGKAHGLLESELVKKAYLGL